MKASIQIYLLVVCSMTYTRQTEGSCYQFGHACFGAHGKRSSGNVLPQVEIRYPETEDRELYPSSDIPREADLAVFNNYIRKWVERIRQELRASGLDDDLRSPVIFPRGMELEAEK